MEVINNFAKKGGIILWDEINGVRRSWVGEHKRFLLHTETGEVYRCSDQEWNDHGKQFVKAMGFYG